MDYDSDRDDPTGSGQLPTRAQTRSGRRQTLANIVALITSFLGLAGALGVVAVPKIGFEPFLSSVFPMVIGLLILLMLWSAWSSYVDKQRRLAAAVFLEAMQFQDVAPDSDYRDYYIQAFRQLERIGQLKLAARLPRPINTNPAINRAQAWKS